MVRRNKQKIKKKKRKSPRKFPRFDLLLDEGLHPPNRFPILSNEHNLYHVNNLKNPPRTDLQIYKYAVEQRLNLIVFNIKDFKRLTRESDEIGIFMVSQTLPVDQIDKKIGAYLRRCKKKSLYGKSIPIKRDNKKK